MTEKDWQNIMKKIISFSLWGNDPKYCVGAIRNAQLAQLYFPEWECVFHCGLDVPGIYLSALEGFKNCTIIHRPENTFGAFWRFESMQPGTIVLSRDCDSRLSMRERHIVDEWLRVDSKMLVIRDHVNHYDFPILAGMWGLRDGLSKTDFEMMNKYNTTHKYLMDQFYLRDIVWRAYQFDGLCQGIRETSWMRASYKEIGKDFIGQSYDINDVPVYDGKLE